MMLASLLLACSSTGADVTLTDLDDPSGRLDESWTADSALWNWSSGSVTLWSLSATTNTLTNLGDVRFDPLTLSTGAGVCGDLQDWLDLGSALVADVTDGDSAGDHCDAITTYLDSWAALDTSDGTEQMTVTAYIDDLVGGTPGTGSWSVPDVTGGMLWSDGTTVDPGEGWDDAACAYTVVEATGESQLWSFPALTLTIDEAESSVVGSLDAEILGDDGGTGTLSVTFDAELCEFTGGAVVVPGA